MEAENPLPLYSRNTDFFKGMQTLKIHTGILMLLFPLFFISNLQSANTFPSTESPLFFTENKGQVRDTQGHPCEQVLYTLRDHGMTIYIYRDGLSYQFEQKEFSDEQFAHGFDMDAAQNMSADQGVYITTHRVDIQFLGANIQASPAAEGMLSFFENYYNIPGFTEGITHVRAFEKVRINNIYPGINWVLYIKNDIVKYEFEVMPGADPSKIQMQVSNADAVTAGEDNYSITTTLGKINDANLFCYEKGTETKIDASFQLDNNIISFSTAQYNADDILIIDPDLIWSTYYGGPGEDAGNAIAIDGDGSIYVTGYTSSSTGMAAAGLAMTYFGGFFDGWLGKFDSLGNRLWVTYYGGTSGDYGTGVCTDPAGHIFIIGFTLSADFLTYGAFQNTYGGSTDGYIAKFNGDGSRDWATFYGGAGYDNCRGIKVDGENNIVVGGYSASAENIAYLGYQNTNSGLEDVFVAKFDQTGNRIWGTYLGGVNDDECRGLTVDGENNIIICGLTESPAAFGHLGYDTIYSKKNDAFISKFNSAGTLLWSTYYGGTLEENANGVVCDDTGNIYTVLQTSSTSGFNCNILNLAKAGGFDALFAKFSPAGSLIWSTYYGGALDDLGKTLCIKNNFLFFSGYANSTDGINLDGFQINNNGMADAFITKLDLDGNLYWSTYFGSTNDEYGRGIVARDINTIYLAGKSFSPTGIGNAGFQMTFGGGPADAFLLKIKDCPTAILSYADADMDGFGNASSVESSCSIPIGYVTDHTDCNDLDINIHPGALETCDLMDDDCNGLIDEDDPEIIGALIWYADLDADGFGDADSTKTACYSPAGYVSDNTDCDDANAAISPAITEVCNAIDDNCNALVDDAVVNPVITPAGPTAVCKPATVLLQGNTGAGFTYQWMKDGGNIAGATNANYTANKSGSYQVKITTTGGCFATSAATVVSVYNTPTANIYAPWGNDLCGYAWLWLYTNYGASYTYQWYKSATPIAGATNINYYPAFTGKYKVTVTNVNGCSKTSSSYTIYKTCREDDQQPVAESLIVYPNPANNFVGVHLDLGNGFAGSAEIVLYNTLGERVIAQSAEIINGTLTTEMDLSGTNASGIYFIRVITGNATFDKQVTIIK